MFKGVEIRSDYFVVLTYKIANKELKIKLYNAF